MNEVLREPNPLELVSNSNGRLALDLFRALQRHAPSQNIVFSPVAISTLLALTASGARGRSLQELCRVLGVQPHEIPYLKYGFAELLDNLHDPDNNCTINVATGLFFSYGYAFRYDFVDHAITYYDAIIDRLDFREDPEHARHSINAWVANRTDNTITKLLPAGSVNALTLMIMATAVYFHAGWMYPFDITKSQVKPFNLAVNVAEDMLMMTNKRKYRFADLPKQRFKILEMPYSTGSVSLYVIRPDQITGIESVSSGLTIDRLNNIMDNMMVSRDVTLTFPQFTVTQDISLRSVLGAIGLKRIFSPSLAELWDMSKGAELSVSELAHAVRLEVTEEGTEGMGGIGQIIALAAMKKVDFNVDRPFIFIIRHNPSKTILFIGRIIKPPVGDTSIGDYFIKLAALNQAPRHGVNNKTGASYICVYVFISLVIRY